MIKWDLMQKRVALARRTVNLGISQAGDANVAPLHALDSGEAYFNCANFIPYVLGLEASQGPNGQPFFNPEHIYADATGPQSMFTRIELPIQGCLLVIPPGPGEDEASAIVTKTEPLMGVECSKSNLPEPIIEHDLSRLADNSRRIYCVLTTDLQ